MSQIPAPKLVPVTVDGQLWLKIELDPSAIRGCWVRLDYAVPVDRPAFRPVLRAMLPAAHAGEPPVAHDQVMPAPVRGFAHWIGFLPETTESLWIQPSILPGDGAFRLTRLKRVALPLLAAAILRRDPGAACLVAANRLLGRREEARQIIREVLLAPVPRQVRPALAPPRPPLEAMPTGMRRSRLVLFIDTPTGQIDDAWLGFERDQTASGYPVHCLPLDLRLMGLETFQTRLLADIRRFLRLAAPAPGRGDVATEEDLWVGFLAAGEAVHPDLAILIADMAHGQPGLKAIYGDLWRLPDQTLSAAEGETIFGLPGAGGLTEAACRGGTASLLLNPDWCPYAFHNRPEGFPTLFARADFALVALQQAGEMHPRQKLEAILMDEGTAALGHVPRPLTARAIEARHGLPTLPDPVPLQALHGDGLVSIIIPTKDRLDVLKPCLESLFAKTVKAQFEVVLVDNGSTDPAVRPYYQALATLHPLRVLDRAGPFNFSWLCNEGAKAASGNVFVFLNNDTEIRSPDWLTVLAALARHPRLGAIGPRLLYADGTVQHEGVVIGMGGLAGHVFRKLRPGETPPGARLFSGFGLQREVAAVTGACLAVERTKFERIGGFNAEDLPVDLNDIDFCLRLVEQGWRNLVVPSLELFHYESQSRGITGKPFSVYRRERTYFRQRWGHVIRHDPCYHPALSLYAASPELD